MNRSDRRRAGFRTPRGHSHALCVHDGAPLLEMSLGDMIANQEAAPLPGLEDMLWQMRATMSLATRLTICTLCFCVVPVGVQHTA